MTALPISYPESTPRTNLSEGILCPVHRTAKQFLGMSERSLLAPFKNNVEFPIPDVEPRNKFVLPNLQWAIVAEGILSSAFKETVHEIDRIAMLQDGWDSYGGKEIREEAIDAAIRLASRILASDTPSPQVVPMSNGGISFEWHENQIDIEIEIETKGACRVYFEDCTSRETFDFLCDQENEHQLLTLILKLSD